jgi:proteasome lid subunit RPN8/RPN11
MGDGPVGVWQTPQLLFPILYSRSAMEGIRLAAMDAFSSLPRGGVEIGGVLLGKFENQQLEIMDYTPFECEHAHGLSFTLSPRDYDSFEELVAGTRARSDKMTAVGWYHSHNRSEVFLSETDLEIYQRYFPEEWQVALVLRPALFQPMRAGFFFRESNGTICTARSYHEFTLKSQAQESPVQPTPESTRPEDGPREPEASLLVSATQAKAHIGPTRAPWAPLLPAGIPRSKRRLWIAGGTVAFGVVLTGFVFQRYDPRSPTLIPPTKVPLAAVTVPSLSATDDNGQLLIRWDTAARAVEQARAGVLSVTDGGSKLEVTLDEPHLRSGSFTYVRQSDDVDIRLSIAVLGEHLESATSFLGPGSTTVDTESAGLARQNQDLRRKVVLLQEEVERLRKPPERKRTATRYFDIDPLN